MRFCKGSVWASGALGALGALGNVEIQDRRE